MTTYVACSYQTEGSDEWEECDEYYMLLDTEEEFNEQIENVIEMFKIDNVDEPDPISNLTFRYETWKEDPNLELKGDAELWHVTEPLDSDGNCFFESTESAVTYMAENDGPFQVRKLVRTNVYGFKTVSLNTKKRKKA